MRKNGHFNYSLNTCFTNSWAAFRQNGIKIIPDRTNKSWWAINRHAMLRTVHNSVRTATSNKKYTTGELRWQYLSFDRHQNRCWWIRSAYHPPRSGRTAEKGTQHRTWCVLRRIRPAPKKHQRHTITQPHTIQGRIWCLWCSRIDTSLSGSKNVNPPATKAGTPASVQGTSLNGAKLRAPGKTNQAVSLASAI